MATLCQTSAKENVEKEALFLACKKHLAWHHPRITDEFRNILNIIIFIWSQKNKVTEVTKVLAKQQWVENVVIYFANEKEMLQELKLAQAKRLSISFGNKKNSISNSSSHNVPLTL